jgi:hypothetical protein
MTSWKDIRRRNYHVYDRVVRFWLNYDRADRFGPKNVGVSAYSQRQALDIVDMCGIEVLASLSSLGLHDTRSFDVITEFDTRLLDPIRVLPYIGDVSRVGVWWPLKVSLDWPRPPDGQS